MPVIKCPNGKYRIGSGPCVYTSKAAADRAYAAYRARTHASLSAQDVMKKFYEPGLDITPNSIRVRQNAPGLYSRFRTIVLGKPADGIKAVYGKKKSDGKWAIQTLIFDKAKWTPAQVRKWCKDHGYVTAGEWTDLSKLTPYMRRLFDYRVDLANEWRGYYMEALEKGEKPPEMYAWIKFKAVYERSKHTGRWMQKK